MKYHYQILPNTDFEKQNPLQPPFGSQKVRKNRGVKSDQNWGQKSFSNLTIEIKKDSRGRTPLDIGVIDNLKKNPLQPPLGFQKVRKKRGVKLDQNWGQKSIYNLNID